VLPRPGRIAARTDVFIWSSGVSHGSDLNNGVITTFGGRPFDGCRLFIGNVDPTSVVGFQRGSVGEVETPSAGHHLNGWHVFLNTNWSRGRLLRRPLRFGLRPAAAGGVPSPLDAAETAGELRGNGNQGSIKEQ